MLYYCTDVLYEKPLWQLIMAGFFIKLPKYMHQISKYIVPEILYISDSTYGTEYRIIKQTWSTDRNDLLGVFKLWCQENNLQVTTLAELVTYFMIDGCLKHTYLQLVDISLHCWALPYMMYSTLTSNQSNGSKFQIICALIGSLVSSCTASWNVPSLQTKGSMFYEPLCKFQQACHALLTVGNNLIGW